MVVYLYDWNKNIQLHPIAAPDKINSTIFSFIETQEGFCLTKKLVQIKNKLPIIPLRSAISLEDRLIFLTKIPMLPNISMAVMILSFPFTFVPPVAQQLSISFEIVVYG